MARDPFAGLEPAEQDPFAGLEPVEVPVAPLAVELPRRGALAVGARAVGAIAGLPPQVPDPEHVELAAKSLASGYATVGRGTGAALELAGAEDLGRTVYDFWKKRQEEWAPPPELNRDILAAPELLANTRWWAANAPQVVGTMLPFMVPAVGGAAGAYKLARLARIGTKGAGYAAALGGNVASTASNALFEGALAYKSAEEAGAGKATAADIAATVARRNALWTGATSAVGLFNPLIKGLVTRMAVGALAEGVQETGEEYIPEQTLYAAGLGPPAKVRATPFVLGAVGGAGGGAIIESLSEIMEQSGMPRQVAQERARKALEQVLEDGFEDTLVPEPGIEPEVPPADVAEAPATAGAMMPGTLITEQPGPAIAPLDPRVEEIMARTGITDPEVAAWLAQPPENVPEALPAGPGGPPVPVTAPAVIPTPAAPPAAPGVLKSDAGEPEGGDITFYEPFEDILRAPATAEELAEAERAAAAPIHEEAPGEIARRFPGAPSAFLERLLRRVARAGYPLHPEAAKAFPALATEIAEGAKEAARLAAASAEGDTRPASALIKRMGGIDLEALKRVGEAGEGKDLASGVIKKGGALKGWDHAAELLYEAGLIRERDVKLAQDLLRDEARRPAGRGRGPGAVSKKAMRALRPRKQPLMPEEVAATVERVGIKLGAEFPLIRQITDPVFGRIKKGTPIQVVSVDLEGGNVLIEYGDPAMVGGREVAVVPIQAIAEPVRAAPPPVERPKAVGERVERVTGVKPEEAEITLPQAQALRAQLKAEQRGAARAARMERAKARQAILEQFRIQQDIKAQARVSENWQIAIRRQIVEYAREALPVASRGKLLSRAASARTMGDLAGAFFAINHEANIVHNKEIIQDIRILTDRAMSSKTFPVAFKIRIRELLADVRLENWSNETVERIQANQEFIDHLRATGEDVEVPQRILDEISKLALRPLGEINSTELDAIFDNLRFLVSTGKDVRAAIRALDALEHEENLETLVQGATDATVEEFASTGQGVKRAFLGPVLTWAQRNKNRWLKVIDFYQQTRQALTPIQVIVDDEGPAARAILYQPLQDGYIQRSSEVSQAHDLLAETLKKYGPLDDLQRDRILTVLYRDQKDVRPHLRKMGVTDAKIDAIELSDKEKGWAESLKSYFAKSENIAALARVSGKLYNQEFVAVDNYFPIMTKYDPRDPGVTVEEIVREELDLRRKNVDRGRIIERRVGAARELRTDLEGIFLDAARQQANLKHMAEPILKAHALVRDARYLEARGGIRAEFWKDYLDTLARDGRFPLSKAEWVVDFFRKNLSASALSFKPHVALLQFSSLGSGATIVGGGNLKTALRAGPVWDDFVDKEMPLIRERKGGDPAVREVLEGSLLPGIKEAGFKHIAQADHWAARKVALAAYFQYLDVHGLEPDANKPVRAGLNYAQGVVGRSMASPWLIDMPLALSRGGPLVKSLLQFQSETLAKFAILTHQVFGKKGGTETERAEDLAWMGASLIYEAGVRSAWIVGVMGVLYGIGAIDKKQYDDRVDADDLIFKNLVLGALNTVPLVGSVGNYIAYDSGPIPIVDVAGDALKGAANLVTGTVQERPIKASRGLIQSLTAAAQLSGIYGAGIVGWLAKQPLRGKKDRIERKRKH